MKKRIVIIDDQAMFRESIAGSLGREEDMEIAGLWGSAEEAFRGLDGMEFDVAVVDYILPGMNGIEAIGKIKALNKESRIVILSMYDRPDDIVEAFRAGAMAYLPKDASVKDLVAAIRQIGSGEPVLPPKLIKKVISYCIELRNSRAERIELPGDSLTILKLASSGCANKEIAAKMGIGIETVKTRLKEIFFRLGARDRTHAVMLALKSGFLHPD